MKSQCIESFDEKFINSPIIVTSLINKEISLLIKKVERDYERNG